MTDPAIDRPFSLLGGPLHRLGSRLGLVEGATNTIRLGLALGGLAWVVLVVLALIDGLGSELFTLKIIGGHVRLLVLVPLVFACESSVAPRMAGFVERTLRARSVASRSRPELEAEIARVGRWTDSWLLDGLCLATAFLLQALARHTMAMGLSMAPQHEHAVAAQSLSAWWWWNVCLVLARFVILRWFVRFSLWSYFLWRVSRLKLVLLPNHPDGAGGLGGLETIHRGFLPIIIGFAAVVSASFAEEVALGTMSFSEIYPALALMLAAVTAVFIGPLLVFTPELNIARLRGVRSFRSLAAEYARQFDEKWLGDAPPVDTLLGTPDLQSLADLDNTFRAAREMRIIPAGPNLVATCAAGVVLPFLPLLLLKYPIAELATILVKRVSGL